MKKQIFTILFLSIAFILPLTAQSHTSVPLDDPIYFLLETTTLKGYCNPPVVRPYSLSTALSLLQQVIESSHASDTEV